MAIIEKKPQKKEIDEQMVDEIIKQTQKKKSFKEQVYDKINIPVWVMDIIIVLLVAAFVLVILFGRG